MSRKKLTTFVLYPLFGLMALIALLSAGIYALSAYRLGRPHQVTARAIAIPTGPSAVERGRHIASTRGCRECHGSDLAGNKVVDDPLVGKIYGPNLTRGAGGLAPESTDMDLIRAIRHGVARDGHTLLVMPSQEFTELSDEDLGAVIAFLKSVPAVDKPSGPVKPGPLARTLIVAGQLKLPAEIIDHQAVQIASIAPSVSSTYGKYLVSNCTGCHGSNLSGGKIPGAPPSWPVAANLTPHPANHVAHWTEAEFMTVIRTQKRPDGTALNPVMPAAFSAMTDVELKALWSYLQTLPAVQNSGA